MAKRRIIAPTQPTIEDERELLEIVNDDAQSVEIRGKQFKLKQISPYGLLKISQIMTNEDTPELLVSCQCLAAAKLNGYFKLKFFWGLLWRYYAYIKGYTDEELIQAVAEIKKKAVVAQVMYCVNTTSLIEVKATKMKMTRAEAEATLRELSSVSSGKSAKNDQV